MWGREEGVSKKCIVCSTIKSDTNLLVSVLGYEARSLGKVLEYNTHTFLVLRTVALGVTLPPGHVSSHQQNPHTLEQVCGALQRKTVPSLYEHAVLLV